MSRHLSDYVFTAKYARYLEGEGRRETYDESIDRMMDMHTKKYNDYFGSIRGSLYKKEIAGSQRALQFGGTAIEEKNARLYNCTVSFCDRASFFSECYYLLLCGCGVGFSVQRHHVSQLPVLTPPKGEYYHVIKDSIEGWSDALKALICAYFNEHGQLPSFEYSSIREEGAPLRHGGKAPGFAPLKKALDEVRKILNGALNRQLKPIECFDMVMHIADSVISGGIRRSATICIFSLSDKEMIEAKTGNWFVDNPQRGRANISAMVTPHTDYEEYSSLFKSTREYGEPAFIFSPSTEYINNPCVEITMCPLLIKKDGEVVEEYTLNLVDPTIREVWEDEGYTFESGFQMCNLTTVNCATVQDKQDFLNRVYLATELGTLQSGYYDFNYLTGVTKEIVKRESLLGVSLTGILSKWEMLKSCLIEASELSVQVNKATCSKYGLRQASRITCIKPEGTASLVLNTSSGIHPYHAPKYIRRVQANKYEDVYKHFEAVNPVACSVSVWGNQETARVIEFPCLAPPSSIVKSDLSALSHLKIAKRVQLDWVRRGTALPNRLEGAFHNVSITVTVHKDEWFHVKNYLWENREFFTGVSFLASSGDYDYQQPPFQEVVDPALLDESDPHFEEKRKMWIRWNELSLHLKQVQYEDLKEDQDNTHVQDALACAGGSCELPYDMEQSK